MPRRRRLRKVVAPPGFRGYRPYGHAGRKQHAVELMYEEYEAIKLADYDRMNHQEASGLMGVSRATFARIYESARRKMAQALVETREIRAVYGHATMDKSWFVCRDCHARFNAGQNGQEEACPVCKSESVELLNKDL